MGIAFDEPSAVEGLYAHTTHTFESSGKMRVCGVFSFYLHRSCLVAERTDETISVAIF